MKLGDLGEEAMTPPDDLAGRARACAHWITNESSSHQEISDALIAFAQAERQRVWEEAAVNWESIHKVRSTIYEKIGDMAMKERGKIRNEECLAFVQWCRQRAQEEGA